MLRSSGILTYLIFSLSESGSVVFAEGLSREKSLLEESVLAVGNAPAAIQVAGQFREAARDLDPEFDKNGLQLFMAGDSIPVARSGEGPKTHQNPLSALGQIARNALILHKQAQTLQQ
jgi:hypothetical protein